MVLLLLVSAYSLIVSVPASDATLSEHVIIIVLDGCRSDKLDLAVTPHIDHLMKKGVVAEECHTTLPSMTVGTHTSLATGAYTGTHGIVAEKYYNWTTSEKVYLAGYPETVEAMTIYEVIEKPAHEELVTALIAAKDKLCMMTGGAEIDVEILGSDYIPEEIMALKYEYADPKSGSVQKAFRAKLTMNRLTMDQVLNVMREDAPNLLIVNMPAIDYVGHVYGPESKFYKKAIEHADHQIGRLMGYLHRDGLWDETTLIVTADHGMTQTDPENIVTDVGITVDHYMTDTGGTSGFVWLKNIGDLQGALSNMSSDARFESLYTQDGDGANGTLASLNLDHERAGDIWFVLAETWIINYPNNGGHGSTYLSDWSTPLVMCGAGIKAGATIDDAEIVDLAPTALKLLGITPNELLDKQGYVLEEALDG